MGDNIDPTTGGDFGGTSEGERPQRGNAPRARIARAFGGRTAAAARSGNQSETEAGEVGPGAQIEVGTQELKAGRRARLKRTYPAPTATGAKGSATRVVKLMDTAARTFVGSVTFADGQVLSAAMTKEERDEIAEPLAALMQRHAAILHAVGQVSDPLALIIAMSMWVVRMAMVFRLKQQMQAQLIARQAAQEEAPHGPDIATIRNMTPDQVAEVLAGQNANRANDNGYAADVASLFARE